MRLSDGIADEKAIELRAFNLFECLCRGSGVWTIAAMPDCCSAWQTANRSTSLSSNTRTRECAAPRRFYRPRYSYSSLHSILKA